MKRLIHFVFIIFLASCSSPKNTAQEFLEAMNSSQFETAMNLVSEESKPLLYNIINDNTGEIPKMKINVKECASLDEKDQNLVCIYSVNDGTETFERSIVLVKENQKWKVDLTQMK